VTFLFWMAPASASVATSHIRFERGRQAVIPTTNASGVQLFQVRIAGASEVLWFLIDSGSSYTLMDKTVATRLGLERQTSASVRGAGGGELKVDVVPGVTFHLPGVTSFKHEVRLTDLTGIEPMLGHRIDGLFGYDLLMRVVATFDFDQQRIVVTDPTRFDYRGGGVVLPIQFGGRTGRWIYVRATVKVPGQPPEESLFFVDSGSTDAANHPLIKKSTGPLRETQGGIGLGAAGGAAVLGRLEWLRLGRFEIRDVPSACCGGAEGTHAQLGQAVLSRFVITYDYARKQMILEPGKRLREPFTQ
jgi:hypothetical protein